MSRWRHPAFRRLVRAALLAYPRVARDRDGEEVEAAALAAFAARRAGGDGRASRSERGRCWTW